MGLDGASRRLGSSETDSSIVVVGNYRVSPITAVQCRAQFLFFNVRRSCFAPIINPSSKGLMVEAAGSAPASDPSSIQAV